MHVVVVVVLSSTSGGDAQLEFRDRLAEKCNNEQNGDDYIRRKRELTDSI